MCQPLVTSWTRLQKILLHNVLHPTPTHFLAPCTHELPSLAATQIDLHGGCILHSPLTRCALTVRLGDEFAGDGSVQIRVPARLADTQLVFSQRTLLLPLIPIACSEKPIVKHVIQFCPKKFVSSCV